MYRAVTTVHFENFKCYYYALAHFGYSPYMYKTEKLWQSIKFGDFRCDRLKLHNCFFLKSALTPIYCF